MNTPIENHQHDKRQQEISEEIKHLMEKQQVSKSFLSRFASTYVNYPWWARWVLGALCGGIGGIVGLFVSPLLFPVASIFGAIIGLVSFIIPTRILKNHYQAELEYQKKLASEVLKLEDVLNESIQEIHSLEKPMHALLDSLNVKNKERARSNELFQASVQSFKRQADEASQAVENLNENQAIMTTRNQSLSLLVAETTDAHHQLSQTQKEMSQISEALSSTKESLLQDTTVFHELAEHVEQSNVELDALQNQFKLIEQHAVATQHAFETHLNTLNQSLSRNTLKETPTEQQESSDALGKSVLTNLDRYIKFKKGLKFFKDTPSDEISSTDKVPIALRT